MHTLQRQRKITKKILDLRRCLRLLDRSLRRLTPVLSASMPMNDAPKSNGRARPRLSPKARASMVLQGRYMGYVRQLKPR